MSAMVRAECWKGSPCSPDRWIPLSAPIGAGRSTVCAGNAAQSGSHNPDPCRGNHSDAKEST